MADYSIDHRAAMFIHPETRGRVKAKHVTGTRAIGPRVLRLVEHTPAPTSARDGLVVVLGLTG